MGDLCPQSNSVACVVTDAISIGNGTGTFLERANCRPVDARVINKFPGALTGDIFHLICKPEQSEGEDRTTQRSNW